MKHPPRNLTDEEKKLWEDITRHDEKLDSFVKQEAEAPIEPPAESSDEPQPESQPIHQPPQTAKTPPAPLEQGNYANMDGKNAERLRRGNYPIDATLDLHGLYADKAHGALISFINTHYKRQSRCLLIITGKGEMGRGVLKTALPGWLSAEDIAPMILVFDKATAKHGGSGAYYVLLRRKR